ncbi:MAG: hypothetical protein KME28_01825 [Pelatocladus maniniholoensis HA4357-MV3]|jgi:hypothetical protein|uniref:Uncharacterized protein n=1 Tax=Pelatocladus maniniholoensis HA4357-MV3 TaxID=1117104 RepID=A0A9E3H3F2_9NOST|nr:hypothetical protein [Pelatocladus maniniholoensis HA4357-MV3]
MVFEQKPLGCLNVARLVNLREKAQKISATAERLPDKAKLLKLQERVRLATSEQKKLHRQIDAISERTVFQPINYHFHAPVANVAHTVAGNLIANSVQDGGYISEC